MAEKTAIENDSVPNGRFRVAEMMAGDSRDLRMSPQKRRDVPTVQRSGSLSVMQRGKSMPELPLEDRFNRASTIFEDMVVHDDEPRIRRR